MYYRKITGVIYFKLGGKRLRVRNMRPLMRGFSKLVYGITNNITHINTAFIINNNTVIFADRAVVKGTASSKLGELSVYSIKNNNGIKLVT